MGDNTLPVATDEAIIPAEHHNAIVEALSIDIVPRNASRQASTDAGQLGTSLYRWLRLYVKEVIIGVTSEDLKIHSPNSGEIHIEIPNDDKVVLSQGSLAIYTDNVKRFEVTDTGINYDILADIETKHIEDVALSNFFHTSGSIGIGNHFSVNKTVKIGKKYLVIVGFDGYTTSGSSGTYAVVVAGVTKKTWFASTISSDGEYTFIYSAVADTTINFKTVVAVESASLVNAYFQVVEI